MEKENDENDTVNNPTNQEDVEPTATMTNHRNESPDVDSKDNRRGIPIDKGWGWVCVFACFMMHVIIVGIGKSFGILFIPFAEKFGSSSRETAWITALMAFVALSGGPCANSLSVRYSSRKVVFIGGLLAALGCVLSAFATRIWHLYLTYGVISGIGSSLAYAPSIVLVGQYFDKRRALANGLAISGAGVGTFVMPLLMRFFLDVYSVEGTMIVLGGVVLNVCICGMLLRPTEFYTKQHDKKNSFNFHDKKNSLETHNNRSTVAKVTVTSTVEERSRLLSEQESKNDVSMTRETNGDTCDVSMDTCDVNMDTCDDSVPYDTSNQCNTLPKIDGKEQKIRDKEFHETPFRLRANTTPTRRTFDIDPKNSSHMSVNIQSAKSHSEIAHLQSYNTKYNNICTENQKEKSKHVLPKLKKINDLINLESHASSIYASAGDIVTSLQDIPLSIRTPHDIESTINTPSEKIQDLNETKIPQKQSLFSRLFQIRKKTKNNTTTSATLFEWSLLKNPVFMVYILGTFFASIGYPVTFLMVPPHAISLGIPDSRAALLVSIIGICDLIGRVVFGWVSDLKIFPRRYGFFGAMAISGGFCMVVPSLTTFPGLIVFSVGIGLFGGSFVALIAVMLVDVLGPERLFSAFGICVLFQGVAHLTGPPFAGWLQDITGNWNLSFYMCGSMLLIGTIILLFEPVGRKYMDRKSETPVERKCMDRKSETPIV